jgi:hypothetical protein
MEQTMCVCFNIQESVQKMSQMINKCAVEMWVLEENMRICFNVCIPLTWTL